MFFEEPQPSLEEEERRKRTRENIERDSLETFLKDLGREAQQQQEGSGGSGGHTPTAVKHDHTAQSEEKGKRHHHLSDSSAAARTKAGRERARRERLNDRYTSCYDRVAWLGWKVQIFFVARTMHVMTHRFARLVLNSWSSKGTAALPTLRCEHQFMWQRWHAYLLGNEFILGTPWKGMIVRVCELTLALRT